MDPTPMKPLLVQAAGLFCLALALLHCAFWRLFRWREQLARVSRGKLGRSLLGALAALWLLRAALQRPFFAVAGPAVTVGFEALFVAGALLHALPLAL